MGELSMSGERFTSADQPSLRYGKGRVCAEDGCETKLSMYNDGDFCALHHPMEAPRMRGKKIA
ncbi:MAG: hypothetical protein HYX34_14180 [Actinobacteria bacterium]|nr:hypothetical protein [Actinomycetota bacterium]